MAGAVTKPLFALASGAGLIVTARLIDRVGKGIRGAPRDALVADVTPPEIRGAAFGLRQSLDTVGAFLGPLLAVGLMLLWANDFRAVFWVAVVPGVLSVAVLAWGVREPASQGGVRRTNPSGARTSAAWGPPIGGWWPWVRCSRWHVSAKPSWYCAPRTSAYPWHSCPW